MSDTRTSMREFRFLDDKRKQGGLAPKEEARWAQLRHALGFGDRPSSPAAVPSPDPYAQAQAEQWQAQQQQQGYWADDGNWYPYPAEGDPNASPEDAALDGLMQAAPPAYAPQAAWPQPQEQTPWQPQPSFDSPEEPMEVDPEDVMEVDDADVREIEDGQEAYAAVPDFTAEGSVLPSPGPALFNVPVAADALQNHTELSVLPSEPVEPPSFAASLESIPLADVPPPNTLDIPVAFDIPPEHEFSLLPTEPAEPLSTAAPSDPPSLADAPPPNTLDIPISVEPPEPSPPTVDQLPPLTLEPAAAEGTMPTIELSLSDVSTTGVMKAVAPETFIGGEHRVVVHTLGGEVLRGLLRNVDLHDVTLNLVTEAGVAPRHLAMSELMAIFFLSDPGAAPSATSGMKVKVTFVDGREISGQVEGDVNASELGFYLLPDDPPTHASRIFVFKAGLQLVDAA